MKNPAKEELRQNPFSLSELSLKIAKELFPLQDTTSQKRAEIFSFHEAILLHYEIDPKMLLKFIFINVPYDSDLPRDFVVFLDRYHQGQITNFIEKLDIDEVGRLLLQSVQVGRLNSINGPLRPRAIPDFRSNDIVLWMKEKDLLFPIEVKNTLAQPEVEKEVEILKKNILDYDLRRLDPRQQARLLCRISTTRILKENPNLSRDQVVDILVEMRLIDLDEALDDPKRNTKVKKPLIAEPYQRNKVKEWIGDLFPDHRPKKVKTPSK